MSKPALLIIDVQKGMDEPAMGMNRNNPQAEANMALLLAEWRRRRLPVIHVRHCSLEPDSPLRPGLPGHAFKAEVQPLTAEKQFDKSANSAFVGTVLEEYLRGQGVVGLVIVGLTTDHCVSATTRGASDLGFQVTLISDATATFEREGHNAVLYSAAEVHNINLASLSGEFCKIHSTDKMLLELGKFGP